MQYFVFNYQKTTTLITSHGVFIQLQLRSSTTCTNSSNALRKVLALFSLEELRGTRRRLPQDSGLLASECVRASFRGSKMNAAGREKATSGVIISLQKTSDVAPGREVVDGRVSRRWPPFVLSTRYLLAPAAEDPVPTPTGFLPTLRCRRFDPPEKTPREH